MSNQSAPVVAVIAEYVAGAARWSELQGDATAANPVFDRLQQLQKVLRTSAEGRAAIAKLVTSPDAGVRLIAAAHMLAFDPGAAVAALEILEAESGLHALSAKYMLRSFRSGTVDLDW